MSQLCIPFPGRVDMYKFEEVLRQFYKRSHDDSSICFDFAAVEWCDAPELSLVVLWISELLSIGRQVSFVPPSEEPLAHEIALPSTEVGSRISNRIEVYSFLVQCLFIDFLMRKSVLKQDVTRSRVLTRRPKSNSDSLAPLVFFDSSKDQRDFINLLGGQEYEKKFGFVSSVRAVETGEIRDVVLSEIGQNIFEHGEGRFGHLLMTVRNPTRQAGQEKIARRQTKAVSFLGSFFSKAAASGYLVLVLSDKGPGINATLEHAYHFDDLIPEKKAHPTESDIVQYAFLRHSTRKTDEQRLGALRQLLAEGTSLIPPPTGLFSVLKVVRECCGLLVVRTGHSLVAYDFLSLSGAGHNTVKALTNDMDQHLRSLADFGGTQLRIYLPMKVTDRKRFIYLRPPFPTASNRVYSYISLFETFSEYDLAGMGDYAVWLLSVQSQIHKLHCSSGVTPLTAVIDCNRWPSSVAGRKALFCLFDEIQQLQDSNFCAVLVNVGGAVRSVLSERGEMGEKEHVQRMLPLLAFDENGSPDIFGLTPEFATMFLIWFRQFTASPSLENAGMPKDEVIRLSHLVRYDPLEKIYKPVVSWSLVTGAMKEGLKKRVRDHILSQSAGIFHKQGCFLIPSGAYSEGFFELRRLFNNNDMRQNVTSLLGCYLDLLGPETVVTLGKSLGDISRSIKNANLDYITVLEPRNPLSSVKIALLPKGRKLVVITDVIGTQRTLDTVLKICEKHDLLGIFTIVDARQSGPDLNLVSNNRTYALESIVRFPMKFSHDDKPPGYRYEEIKRVDPVSDAPIDEPFLLEQPIWQHMQPETGENNFLEGVLRETNAFIIGHFENNQRHLLYLFLLPQVGQAYGAMIAKTIREDLEGFEKRGGLPNPISHVFYTKSTPGIEGIANAIAMSVGAKVAEGLSSDQVNFPLSFPEADKQQGSALLFDDASSTGRTGFHFFMTPVFAR